MKKHTTTSLLVVPVLFLVSLMLAACDQDQASIQAAERPGNEFKVTSVSQIEFMFTATDPGGIINFNSENIEACDLSFIKSRFKKGYTTRMTKSGEGDIDLTCSNENRLYSLDSSGKASTHAQMTVTDLTDESATVILSFSLFDIRSKDTISKEDISLTLNKQQLTTLFAR